LIVHYHHPHAPYGTRAIREGRATYDWEQDPFTALQNGNVNKETVWEAYIHEIETALESVNLLRKTIEKDKKIAVSADHGEAFGEYGLYRHRLGVPIPAMKKVPWVTLQTTGEKSQQYSPEYPIKDADQYQENIDISEQLENLGYK
jgi:hypothetical protein